MFKLSYFLISVPCSRAVCCGVDGVIPVQCLLSPSLLSEENFALFNTYYCALA